MFPWGKFPFSDEIKKMSENMTSEEVHSYVNNMMKNMMPSAIPNLNIPNLNVNNQSHVNQDSSHVEVFETFDYIYIKMKLPADVGIDQLKIYHTSNKAIIENIHDKNNRQVIVLPCLVKRKGALAQVKDQKLEVRLNKNDDLQFTEISVSEKL